MKKKIISLFLIIAAVLTSVSLPVLAVDNSTAVSEENYERDIEYAKKFGFSEFINVEQYAALCGSPGYDENRVLRIGSPGIGVYNDSYNLLCIPLYIYNPNHENFEYYYDIGWETTDSDAGIIELSMDNEIPINLNAYFGSLLTETVNTVGDHIFRYIEACVYIPDDIMAQYSSAKETSIRLQNVIIGGVEVIKDVTLKLEGIDHKIQFTDPSYDLSFLYDLSQEDIDTWYPDDINGEFSLVYMYESLPGTEDFNLYLYLHNPQKKIIQGFVYVYMYIEDRWTEVRFNPLQYSYDFCSECGSNSCIHQKPLGTLVKLELYDKEIFQEYAASESIRAYPIKLILFNAVGNGKTERVEINSSSIFEFSEESLDSIPELRYVCEYSIFIPLEKEPDKVKQSHLTLDLKGDWEVGAGYRKNSDFEVEFGYLKNGEFVKGDMDLVEVHEGSYGIRNLSEESIVGDSHHLYLRIYFENDFSNAMLNITVDRQRIYDENFIGPIPNLSESIKGSGYYEKSYFHRDEFPASYSLRKTDDSNEKFIRSNVTADIKISCDPTYYRLNNSSTGEDYYATLSSVGFSLPSRYLMETGLLSNSKFNIDYIDVKYKEAYVSGLLTTYDDFIESNWENYADLNGIYTLDDDEYIISGADIDVEWKWRRIFRALGNSLKNFVLLSPPVGIVSFPLSMLGLDLDVAYTFGGQNLISDIAVGQISDIEMQNKLAYVYTVDDSFFETKELIEAIESDTLLEDIKDKQIYSLPLVEVEDRISFDESFSLLSYKDTTFGQVLDDKGIFKAFYWWFAGMDETVDDTIKNISPFCVFYPEDYFDIKSMTDESFVRNYRVALEEVEPMRQKILQALENNQCYVLMRYDVYDYYCSEVDAISPGLTVDGDGTKGYLTGAFCDEKYAVFNTKYYEDLQVIDMQVSDKNISQVYTFKHEPIDYVGPITPPVNVTTDGINTPDEWDWKTIGTTYGVSLLGVVGLVLGVVLIISVINGASTAGVGAGRTVNNISVEVDGQKQKPKASKSKRPKAKKRR